jgi:MOSC domain-containing protein YiiM
VTAVSSVGRLIGIARRSAVRAPMEELNEGRITVDGGLEGDHKGPKFPKRRITVLAIEDWLAALRDLGEADGRAIDLPWTARRANLLVEGIRLPRARGGILRIGPVRLEITYPTQPCRRMDEVHQGLLKALHPEWRGGVTCAVIKGGTIAMGDEAEVLHAPPEVVPRLP